MTLDLLTLNLVLMALALSSTLVLALIWYINREMPGVLLWLISNCLMLASGTINLFSAIQLLSPAMGAFLSNCCSLAGGLLIVEGALRFRGWHSEQRWRIFIGLIALFVMMSWINRLDAPARYLFHDSATMLFSLATAIILLWRLRDIEEFAANLMAATGNLLMLLAAGGRAVAAVFYSDAVVDGLLSIASQWYFFAAILFYMNWTLGLSVACYARSRREVMQLAREDDLTGLPNRRSLDERLALAVADARRSNEAFAVVMMDVNGFKRVNDELGHRAGDQLLMELASRLKSALREVDYAGRLGGDEFLVIIRGAHAFKSMGVLMERLRGYLEGTMALHDGYVDVRISMGAAAWLTDADTIDGLLRVADARMYQQKNAMQRVSIPEQKPEDTAVIVQASIDAARVR